MKTGLLVKVLLCTVPTVLFGGLAYWFYLQPGMTLQAERKIVLDRGLSFLENNLWDPACGCYREVPTFTGTRLSQNHNLDDNYLAYIFQTEYAINSIKASEIHSFLVQNNFTFYNRWIVLSNIQGNYSEYKCPRCNLPTPYGDKGYADHVDLDGIYYWKIGNSSMARERFNFLVGHLLDSRLGFFKDSVTPVEGFVYYKTALGLILAEELGNTTYTDQFARTLSSQQNLDGSWLTGPARPDSVYPNTETTILILIALKTAWNM